MADSSVEPDLGAAQRPEAQIEHLQRQAVTLRVLFLPHVAAPFQQTEQAVNRRCRLTHRTSQLGKAQPMGTPAEHFAHLERLVDGGHGAGGQLRTFHGLE